MSAVWDMVMAGAPGALEGLATGTVLLLEIELLSGWLSEMRLWSQAAILYSPGSWASGFPILCLGFLIYKIG